MRVWHVYLTYLFLAAGAFSAAKYGGFTFPIHYDHPNYTAAFFTLYKRAFEAGEFPWWAPELFFGVPLFFGGSIDLKFSWLLKWIDVWDFLHFHVSWGILFGGLLFFEMAKRVLKSSIEDSLAASLMWIFYMQFVTYFYDTGVTMAFYWIPGHIISLYFLVQEKKSQVFFGLTLLTIGLTDQFYSGRFDSVEYTFWSVGIFALINRNLWKGNLRRTILGLATAVTVALLISSPFLYEQAKLITSSERLGNFPPQQFDFSWFNFFTFVPFSAYFFEKAGGASIYNYVGLGSASVILFGLFGKTTRKPVVIYLLVSAAILVLAYKVEIFGHNLFSITVQKLPGHKGLRYTQRLIYCSYFFLTLAFLMGLKGFAVSEWRNRYRVPAAISFLGALLVALFAFFMPVRPIADTVRLAFSMVFLINAAVVGLIFLCGTNKFLRSVALSLSTVVCACLLTFIVPKAEGWYWNQELLLKVKSVLPDDVSEFLKLKSDVGEWRVLNLTTPRSFGDVAPNILMSNGFRAVYGHFTFVDAKKPKFVREILGGNSRVSDILTSPIFENSKRVGYDLTGVKYWLLKADEVSNKLASENDLRKIFSSSQSDVNIYESSSALPRVYWAKKVEGANDPGNAIEVLAKEISADPVSQKLIVVAGLDPNFRETFEDNGAVRARSGRNDFEVQVSARSKGWLTILDSFGSPYWRAYLDGQPIQMHWANGVFRAFEIPPGDHVLSLRYGLATWCKITFGLGVIFCCFFLFLAVFHHLSLGRSKSL